MDVRHVAKTIVDTTPGNGYPACSVTQARPCRDSGSFVRLSPEGGSTECETRAGPYSATLAGVACNEQTCTAGGNCLKNGGNPLQYVVCRSGPFRISGGNGAASEIPVTVP